MLHEAWKDYLKDNISLDPCRQQLIRGYLDEMERKDREEFVAEEYKRREERLQMRER